MSSIAQLNSRSLGCHGNNCLYSGVSELIQMEVTPEQERYLCQFVDTSLAREQDGSSQHALEEFRSCTLVYPTHALLSDYGA